MTETQKRKKRLFQRMITIGKTANATPNMTKKKIAIGSRSAGMK